MVREAGLLGKKRRFEQLANLLLDDQVFWGMELPENLTYYLYRENLIKAMITGFKTTTVQQTSAPRHGLTAVILIFAVLASSGGYFSGYLTQTENQPYKAFIDSELPDNALWREECGDCHNAAESGQTEAA